GAACDLLSFPTRRSSDLQWSMATQIQGMQGTQPPMSSVPALAEAVRPVGTSVAVPGSTTGETMVQPVNKSLRVKYRCGGCAAPQIRRAHRLTPLPHPSPL